MQARTHPRIRQEGLARIERSLHDLAAQEIQSIESQLTEIERMPDENWRRMEIQWRPAAIFAKELGQLLQLLEVQPPSETGGPTSDPSPRIVFLEGENLPLVKRLQQPESQDAEIPDQRGAPEGADDPESESPQPTFGADIEMLESQNAELRAKIQELNRANQSLAEKLSELDMEKATVEQLRATIQEIEASRIGAFRELKILEQMASAMEKDLVRLRAAGKRLPRLEQRLKDLESRRAELMKTLDESREQQCRMKADHESEIVRLQATIASLSESFGQGMVSETEMFALQKKCDRLENETMQQKTARLQAERDRKKSEQELETERQACHEAQRERDELRVKLRDAEQKHPS